MKLRVQRCSFQGLIARFFQVDESEDWKRHLQCQVAGVYIYENVISHLWCANYYILAQSVVYTNKHTQKALGHLKKKGTKDSWEKIQGWLFMFVCGELMAIFWWCWYRTVPLTAVKGTITSSLNNNLLELLVCVVKVSRLFDVDVWAKANLSTSTSTLRLPALTLGGWWQLADLLF